MVLTSGRHTKKVKEVQSTGMYTGGSYGPMHKWKVIFEDDSFGNLMTKTEQCKDFIPGQNTTFDCEIKQNGEYVNYNIKAFKENAFNGGGKGGGSGLDGKYYAAAKCLELAVEMAKVGKINKDEISGTAEKYFEFVSKLASKQA